MNGDDDSGDGALGDVDDDDSGIGLSVHACISFDDDISPSNELGTVMVNLVDLDER